MYKIPSNQANASAMQNDVLKKWKAENSFKESIKNREGAEEFVFYDGPPFANGLPHYGHLLTSYVKDSVARFQTMIGKKTERRFGWDCHGLPAEMETEKELKVSGRMQIMEYGIEKFNNACRSSVMKYSKEWQNYIEKAGRWVDFNEDYKTMDTPYMESVLWGFKELFKKGLIYEDFRVMPYSWKCETPLSNFETRMDNSYRSHTSKTAIVKIALKTKKEFAEGLKLHALIWTTTPWTLPSNLTIAVNQNLEYCILKTGEEAVIIAKKLAPKFEKELGNEIIAEVKGEELLGMAYHPIFPFFEREENAFKIIHGDFVEDEGGTGLVHIAPGFGEDDWEACKKAGIKIVCPVDDSGKFTPELYPHFQFKTERLAFRDVAKKDETFIAKLLEHHTEMHFDGANEEARFYEEHKKKFGTAPMIITLRETGEVIGLAGVLAHDPNVLLKEGNVEVLCFLAEEHKGKGYGFEALNFFTKMAFIRFKVENIIAVINGKNAESEKMLTKLGFEKEGIIFDPRAKIDITKFSLKCLPNNFKGKNFDFTKAISLNLPEYVKTKNTFEIRKENNVLGLADITNGILNFSFTEETLSNKEIREESLREFLNKFALGEVKTYCEISLVKKLGFFEIKGEKGAKFLPAILNLAGKQVFEANDDVINFLKQEGVLIKQEQYIHNYPHCWRTDTPLIYKAVSSWYVEVSKFKERMVELNKGINWMPSHIKEGQFGKWLENARDWSITRNRFWGTPVPVWKVLNKNTGAEMVHSFAFNSKAKLQEIAVKIRGEREENEFHLIKISLKSGGKLNFSNIESLEDALENGAFEEFEGSLSFKTYFVFGGIAEINGFFGTSITDLHRPFIDDVKKTFRVAEYEIVRVSDVLDCWFESGSMPFASVHYPFENKEWFETHNPADFIVEYVAQTRGWFYTLMVLGAAIFDKAPFKNCLCHGVILDENGQKLSKRLRNYPDPLEVFETFGSDAMRFFLLSSAVVSGGDLNISKDGNEIREVVRLVIKPIWNAYTFFAMYANADGIKATYSTSSEDLLDKYILSKLEIFSHNFKFFLQDYKFPEACREIENFIDTLNNWYIRRSKERFWKHEKDGDKQNAYNTLWTTLTLFAKIISPILPFTAEGLFEMLNS